MTINQLVFQNTMDWIQKDFRLSEATRQLERNTKVYGEGFASKKSVPKGNTKVWFEENLTLCAARENARQGYKTAVLNFANPVEPGGGVLRGASAQEEYLCRASNLYCSLRSLNAGEFYSIHNTIRAKNQVWETFLATDAVIFSPGVTVFKCDKGYTPGSQEAYTQEYTDEWYQIDVITCAAPMFLNQNPTIPDGDLQHLFERRIKNIFEVAIENEAESLILGAFGCGAFRNPPQVVASAFKRCLDSERYHDAFKNVVFAVKGDRGRTENISVFEAVFPR